MTDPRSNETTERPERAFPPLLWPLLLLLGLTALAEWTNADLVVLSWFYTPVPAGFDPELGWTLADRPPWSLVDGMGPMPGIALGVLAGLASLVGHVSRLWSRERDATGFLALCVLVAPLLLVNTLLKSTWGRPRPNMVAEFGGPETHRAVWSPGPHTDRHKSFPSGHAAIGFVMMAPAFLWYRRRRDVYRWWMAGGFAYGALMSSARIVQGSHYPTDVMWSAGLVYLSAAALYWWIEPENLLTAESPSSLEHAPDEPNGTRAAA